MVEKTRAIFDEGRSLMSRIVACQGLSLEHSLGQPPTEGKTNIGTRIVGMYNRIFTDRFTASYGYCNDVRQEYFGIARMKAALPVLRSKLTSRYEKVFLFLHLRTSTAERRRAARTIQEERRTIPGVYHQAWGAGAAPTRLSAAFREFTVRTDGPY